jgi:predicted  nucleic acid-binding Zn-ribbon protein
MKTATRETATRDPQQLHVDANKIRAEMRGLEREIAQMRPRQQPRSEKMAAIETVYKQMKQRYVEAINAWAEAVTAVQQPIVDKLSRELAALPRSPEDLSGELSDFKKWEEVDGRRSALMQEILMAAAPIATAKEGVEMAKRGV